MAYNANLLGPSAPAGAQPATAARLQPHLTNPLHCLDTSGWPYILIPPCKGLKAGQALAKLMGDYLDLFPETN